MTDRERLLKLLEDFDIVPQTEKIDLSDAPEPTDVQLLAQYGGVEGYSGFLCRWEFDDAGKFKRVSIWE